MPTESDQEVTFTPNRKLCPDGSCIGVIGADGKCSVCGAAAAAGLEAESSLRQEHESETAQEGEAEAATMEENPSSFDPDRRLCSDDVCIGVIGTDERCSVCGKPART